MKHQAIPRNEDGFALIAVLGFLFVVALFVTPFVLQARTSFFLAANSAKLDKLEFLTSGLVQVALVRHVQAQSSGAIANGKPTSCSAGEVIVDLSLQDHRGLIDLNASGAALLAVGFRSMGRSETEAKRLADTVVFHRSVRRNTFSGTTYEMQGGERHRRFVSPIELTDMIVEPPLQDWKLASVFTVHTQSGKLFSALAAPDISSLFSEVGGAGLPLEKRVPVTSAPVSVKVSVSDKRRGLAKTIKRVFVIGHAVERKFLSVEILPTERAFDSPSSANANLQSCEQVFGQAVANDLSEFRL